MFTCTIYISLPVTPAFPAEGVLMRIRIRICTIWFISGRGFASCSLNKHKDDYSQPCYSLQLGCKLPSILFVQNKCHQYVSKFRPYDYQVALSYSVSYMFSTCVSHEYKVTLGTFQLLILNASAFLLILQLAHTMNSGYVFKCFACVSQTTYLFI